MSIKDTAGEKFNFRQKAPVLGEAIQTAFPNQDTPELIPTSGWEELNAVREEIAAYLMMVSESIGRTISLVEVNGCLHPEEFDTTARATAADIDRFTQLYVDIQEKHKDYSGAITDPDEHTFMLSIFEEYFTLRGLIDGVLQPALISFTDFALEAKDIALAKAAAQPKTQVEDQQ